MLNQKTADTIFFCCTNIINCSLVYNAIIQCHQCQLLLVVKMTSQKSPRWSSISHTIDQDIAWTTYLTYFFSITGTPPFKMFMKKVCINALKLLYLEYICRTTVYSVGVVGQVAGLLFWHCQRLICNFKEIVPLLTHRLRDPSRMTRRQRLYTWLADMLLMRKALFNHLTARGIQVYIWVLNDEEDFRRAFDLGATGIMTDYPTKLKEFLENNSIS